MTILFALSIIFIINTEIFAMVQVEQQSMESTLFPGERLLVNRLGWQTAGPHRGEIVIFLPEREVGTFWEGVSLFIDDYKSIFDRSTAPRRYVKRVIGLPGDEIDIRDGMVYINGAELEEDYAKGLTYSADCNFPTIVPEGHLFVLGDNREVSRDSRAFGTIKQESVIGEAFFRMMPLTRVGFLN
jgi:signal peptidase I